MNLLSADEKLSEKSDEEVLALSVVHPSCFGEIVDRYQEAFMRKVIRIVFVKEEAEDIIQETFTKIYVNAARFKKVDGAKFSSWAYKILINTAFTHYKKLKRKDELVSNVEYDFLASFPDSGERDIEKQDLRDTVISLMSRIPSHLARVLTLQFIEERSQEEIAAIEGISVSAVKTRVYRAKKELKNASLNEVM